MHDVYLLVFYHAAGVNPLGGSVDAALRKRCSIHAVQSFENELRHDSGMDMSERLGIAQHVSQSKQPATHV